MLRFKLVGQTLEGIALFSLGAFILFTVLIDSTILRYFLIILSVIIASLLFYHVTFIYDDKIVVKFPLLFLKKEFTISEIKRVRIFKKLTFRFISFELNKRVILMKSVSYSGGGLQLDDINKFFSEKNVPVKFTNDII